MIAYIREREGGKEREKEREGGRGREIERVIQRQRKRKTQKGVVSINCDPNLKNTFNQPGTMCVLLFYPFYLLVY